MGTISWCPGLGRLWLSLIYPHPSDTGNPCSSLFLGMIVSGEGCFNVVQYLGRHWPCNDECTRHLYHQRPPGPFWRACQWDCGSSHPQTHPGSKLVPFSFPFFFFCLVLRDESSFQVLGETIHITLEYLSQEAKAISARSKLQGMEAENSSIRRTLSQPWMRPTLPRRRWGSCLTTWGAERQLTLEKDEQLQAAKERVKAIAAKSVEAFQQTDEYNTMLFS